jgi:uncharacterized protein (TIGR02145 family)
MAKEKLRKRIAGNRIYATVAEKDRNLDNIVMADKADKVGTGHGNNIASFDSDGNLKDSGVAASSLTSKDAAEGGTALSLVTTGEKYTWNNWTSASKSIPPRDGVTIAGRKYEYKKFGNLEWMMESLKYDTDTTEALYINTTQNVYYYKGDFIFNSTEFASIIPAGWRVPTEEDRDALVAAVGGANEAGATYLFNNFNVEPSAFYDGYYPYPGGYISKYQFCIVTKGNWPTGAVLIDKSTPPKIVNSGNTGGGGYDARFPVRLCRNAPASQGA